MITFGAARPRDRSLSPNRDFRVRGLFEDIQVTSIGAQNQIKLYKALGDRIGENGDTFLALKHPHWYTDQVERAKAEKKFIQTISSLINKGRERILLRLKLKNDSNGEEYPVGKHIVGVDINPESKKVLYIDPYKGEKASKSTENLVNQIIPAADFSHTTEEQETVASFANSFDCSLWTGFNLYNRSHGIPLPTTADLPELRKQGKILVEGYKKNIEKLKRVLLIIARLHYKAVQIKARPYLQTFDELPENIVKWIPLPGFRRNNYNQRSPYLYPGSLQGNRAHSERKRLLDLKWTPEEESEMERNHDEGFASDLERLFDIEDAKILREKIEHLIRDKANQYEKNKDLWRELPFLYRTKDERREQEAANERQLIRNIRKRHGSKILDQLGIKRTNSNGPRH